MALQCPLRGRHEPGKSQEPGRSPNGDPLPPSADFENTGTEQPKLDFRLDYEPEENKVWSFRAGSMDSGGSGTRAFGARMAAGRRTGVTVNVLTVGLASRPEISSPPESIARRSCACMEGSSRKTAERNNILRNRIIISPRRAVS